MDTKTFNDRLVHRACLRLVAEGHTITIEGAYSWLEKLKQTPVLPRRNSSFAERGRVKTLTTICRHAFQILSARKRGEEIQLSRNIWAYYLPRFEKEVATGQARRDGGENT